MIVDSPLNTGKQSMAMTPEGRASVWRTSRLAGSGLIGKPSSLQQDTRTTTTTLPSPRPMILEGRCTLSLRVSDPSGELGPNMKGTTTGLTVKKSSQSTLTLKGSSTPPKTSGKSTLARMVRPKSPSLRTSAQSSGNCLWTRTGQTSTGRDATLTTLPTRVSASKTSSTAGLSGTSWPLTVSNEQVPQNFQHKLLCNLLTCLLTNGRDKILLFCDFKIQNWNSTPIKVLSLDPDQGFDHI